MGKGQISGMLNLQPLNFMSGDFSKVDSTLITHGAVFLISIIM